MTAADPLAPVAPELRAGLAFFPDFEFGDDLSMFRSGLSGRELPPLPAELAAVACVERHVPGAAGDPPVRLLHYTPPALSAAGAILHIHGGGYVLGTAEINDAGNRGLALALGCTVVSVDYRLAPECTFPGALNDCYAALAWLHGEAAALGFDPARIVVTGESAGGGHAAALALHARDRHRADPSSPTIAALVMDAPMLDDRTGTASDPHPHTGQFVWTPSKNRFGWSALLGQPAGTDKVPAGAVPARAADVSGLPPSFITVGALDLFLEENLEWTRRLSRAGTPVELHVIPGAYHGFAMAPDTPQATQVAQLRLAALRRFLGAA